MENHFFREASMVETKIQGIEEFEKALELLFKAKYKEANKLFQKLSANEDVDPALAAKAAENGRICDNKLQVVEFSASTFNEYADLAVFHLNRMEAEEAEKYYEKMTELDPKNEFCFYFATLLETQKGNHEKALEALKKATDADPANKIRAGNEPDLRPLREKARFKELVETEE
jgi:tetratricopeptide (TPR) repeat protein